MVEEKRGIELKRGYNTHDGVRLTHASRQVPTVLQVCGQSRHEAIRLGYKRVDFC